MCNFGIDPAWHSLNFSDVVCCPSLMTDNYPKLMMIIISKISSPFSFPFGILITHLVYLLKSPPFLECFALFLYFLFAIQFGKFVLTYFQAHRYISCIESAHESVEGLLHFCCGGFDF